MKIQKHCFRFKFSLTHILYKGKETQNKLKKVVTISKVTSLENGRTNLNKDSQKTSITFTPRE